jgi:hypothetical protein
MVVTTLKATVHAPVKPTAKSREKTATPGGSARILLPVNDAPDRGRMPCLRDELAVVVPISTYPRERLPLKAGFL